MLGQTRNLALVVRIRRMLKSLSIVVLVAATAACGGAKTSGTKPTVVADPASAFGPLQEGADYQTYTKMSKAPFASPTHGGRDVEVWVNAAGVEAYKKGEPSPAGTIIVKSSTEKADDGSTIPGPLFVMSKKDKDWSYALYWEKPSAKWIKQLGGPVYWRTPSPKAAYCVECHENYDNELGGVPEEARAW